MSRARRIIALCFWLLAAGEAAGAVFTGFVWGPTHIGVAAVLVGLSALGAGGLTAIGALYWRSQL